MGFSCRSCHGSSWPSHQFWPWYSWWVALRRVAASVCQCFLLSCLAPLTGFYITQVVGDGGISDHQGNSEALSSVKSIMTWPKGFQVVFPGLVTQIMQEQQHLSSWVDDPIASIPPSDGWCSATVEAHFQQWHKLFVGKWFWCALLSFSVFGRQNCSHSWNLTPQEI